MVADSFWGAAVQAAGHSSLPRSEICLTVAAAVVAAAVAAVAAAAVAAVAAPAAHAASDACASYSIARGSPGTSATQEADSYDVSTNGSNRQNTFPLGIDSWLTMVRVPLVCK